MLNIFHYTKRTHKEQSHCTLDLDLAFNHEYIFCLNDHIYKLKRSQTLSPKRLDAVCIKHPTRTNNKCEKSLKKERALNFKQKDSSCLHLTLTVCGPLGERTHHRSISHYTHCAPPAHHIHAISSPSCIYNFSKQYLDANHLDN